MDRQYVDTAVSLKDWQRCPTVAVERQTGGPQLNLAGLLWEVSLFRCVAPFHIWNPLMYSVKTTWDKF